MTEEKQIALINAVVYGYGQARLAKAQREHREFVHYTSAEAALSIISNSEVWLRNSAIMNDWSEIAHGEECFKYVLYQDNETRHRSEQVLGLVRQGLHADLASYFEQSAPLRRSHTYLISISEHGPAYVGPGVVINDSEYTFGRLSMWRAYGNTGGIALVFNQEPFFGELELNAYSAPVFYGVPTDFAMEWERLLARITDNIEAIRQLPDGMFEENLRRSVHLSSLSCKHPGFQEEREWRITYSADPAGEGFDDEAFNAANAIQREVRSINGVPQRLYKLPLKDNERLGIKGISLPDVLSRIIIGPTQYPIVLFDALYMALVRAGVPDPHTKIAISNIPLRT